MSFGLGGKRGFEVSKGQLTFRIQLDACACEGGAQRWLRVLVATSGSEGKQTRALSSSSDMPRRVFTIRHAPDHPHHVCSWSFAAGLASHQFHLDLADGTSWTIQLTLGLQELGGGTRLRSFALGVEILSRLSNETDCTHTSRPSISSHWVPPMTIQGPQMSQRG